MQAEPILILIGVFALFPNYEALYQHQLAGVHGEGGHGNVISDSEVDRGCCIRLGIRPVHGLVVSLQLVHSVDLTDAVGRWSFGIIQGEL